MTVTPTSTSPRVAALDYLKRMSSSFIQPSLLAWRACEAGFYEVGDARPVIDLGAGLGHFTREVAPRAVAVDIDLLQLKEGRASGALQVAVCADIGALPFRTGSVSQVISNCVLEHLEDLRGALAEVRRVLAPEGTLQTTVPLQEINNAYVMKSARYHALRNRQLSHRTLLTRDGWRDLLASSGFSVVREGSAVSRRQGRRWDILDAPLFLRLGGKTVFGAYTRLLRQLPVLQHANSAASQPLARWIIAGGDDGHPICEFLEVRVAPVLS